MAQRQWVDRPGMAILGVGMAASVQQLAVAARMPGEDHVSPGAPRGVGTATRRSAGADPGREAEQLFHARLVAAVEAERACIARELHDVVGQALTAVRLSLLGLEAGERAQSPSPGITSSLEAVDDAIRRVRTASFDLRPSVLDDLGLAPALRELGRRVARESGVAVSCRFALGDGRLAPEVETTCFRIAQEAITNVIRHARARNLHVRVALRRTGTLVLEVRDDGAGFDPARCTDALGLRGMAERAAIVGGCVEVRSGAGMGTAVVARLPGVRAMPATP